MVIKPDRSDKTEIKKFFLKISGHQQRWPRPLPGAFLIPPALLVVADLDVKDLEPAVQRVVGLGGTKLDEISEYGITWAVMADPDGNEFCLVKHS